MKKIMISKKMLLLMITLFITTHSFADIIGIGQVADKYIYKINGVIVSVSAGDVIDGCVVKIDSGLQCDDTFNRVKNTESAIESIEDKILKFETMSSLVQKNIDLKNQLNSITMQLRNSQHEAIKSKKYAIITINKRNAVINRLSSRLNAKNSN